jgi:hypothetical protein
LEHHRGRVDYEWVEALGWFQQDDKNNVTGTGKEWYYHWKADEVRRRWFSYMYIFVLRKWVHY